MVILDFAAAAVSLTGCQDAMQRFRLPGEPPQLVRHEPGRDVLRCWRPIATRSRTCWRASRS